MPLNLLWVYCKKPHGSVIPIINQQTCICSLNHKAKMPTNSLKKCKRFFSFLLVDFTQLINLVNKSFDLNQTNSG